MNGCKHILICTEDIIPNCKFMRDRAGRLDLLGQILFTGYGIKIHERIESPAHQGLIMYPFTVRLRDRSHNTELTLKLLKNAQKMSGLQQLNTANELLDEHCIYLEKM